MVRLAGSTLGVLSLWVALSPAAYAEKESEVEMQVMEVVAEESDIRFEDSPFPVSVIDAARFHGRSISLNDVLRQAAGVRVNQEGGLGSRSTVSIHGLEGKRVRIFIDGDPLNSPDGSFGINDIAIQLIERIEIYKGIVPVRFGGDALGGAINVVTRSFDGDWVDLGATVGSYNTQRLSALVTKELEEQNIEIGAGGFFNHSDNNYRMDVPGQRGLTVTRENDAFTSYVVAVSAKAKKRYFDEVELELVTYRAEKEIQGVEYRINKARTESEAQVANLSFDKSNFLFDGLTLDYGIGHFTINNYFIDKATECYDFANNSIRCPGQGGRGEVGDYPRDSDDELIELRQDLDLRYQFNREHVVTLHLNHRTSDFEPTDKLGIETSALPSELITQVLSLGYEAAFFDDRLVTDVGAKRYSYNYKITGTERNIGGERERNKNSEDFDGHYLSLRFSPLSGLYFKTAYEKAFRLPTTEEAFGNGVSIVASPDIKPEKADNYYTGVYFERNDFAGLNWLKLEANLFERDVRDMMKLQSAGVSKSVYVNLGEINVKGFELEAKTDLNNQWYLYASYTRQEQKDQQRYATGTLSSPNPTFGKDVPNVAKQYASAGLEYKYFGLWQPDSVLKLFWETNWFDEFAHKWELTRNQNRKVKAQTEHATGFLYSFHNDQMHIGFDIRNLTDEKLNDIYNMPLPGRSYNLTVRYSWFE